MKNILFSLALPFILLPDNSKESYLIVGTYTGEKSEGVYVYKFNSEDGSFKEISHVKNI